MHPSSDLQFLAQILRKVHDGNQVKVAELDRLDQIGAMGHSNSTPSRPLSQEATIALSDGATDRRGVS